MANTMNSVGIMYGGLRNDDMSLKEAHDRYNVYINDEFVGDKILLTQTENISDVKDYIVEKGFANITAQLQGDHYVIEANQDEAGQIKTLLDTYLKIR